MKFPKVLKFAKFAFYAYFIAASTAVTFFINTLGYFSGDYFMFAFGQYAALLQANGFYFMLGAARDSMQAWADNKYL